MVRCLMIPVSFPCVPTTPRVRPVWPIPKDDTLLVRVIRTAISRFNPLIRSSSLESFVKTPRMSWRVK